MKTWFQIAVCVLVVPALGAGMTGAAEVHLSLQAEGHAHYTIEGRFWTPADPSVAWNTLSDYDHLADVIPSLKSSHVQEKHEDYILLRQEAVGQALFFFHRRLLVLLKVQEDPPRRITFEDVSKHDFESYSGWWEIETDAGGGSWVTYHLATTPHFYAPAYVARRAFLGNARDLLVSVQKEIIRRGDLRRPQLCCSQRKE